MAVYVLPEDKRGDAWNKAFLALGDMVANRNDEAQYANAAKGLLSGSTQPQVVQPQQGGLIGGTGVAQGTVPNVGGQPQLNDNVAWVDKSQGLLQNVVGTPQTQGKVPLADATNAGQAGDIPIQEVAKSATPVPAVAGVGLMSQATGINMPQRTNLINEVIGLVGSGKLSRANTDRIIALANMKQTRDDLDYTDKMTEFFTNKLSTVTNEADAFKVGLQMKAKGINVSPEFLTGAYGKNYTYKDQVVQGPDGQQHHQILAVDKEGNTKLVASTPVGMSEYQKGELEIARERNAMGWAGIAAKGSGAGGKGNTMSLNDLHTAQTIILNAEKNWRAQTDPKGNLINEFRPRSDFYKEVGGPLIAQISLGDPTVAHVLAANAGMQPKRQEAESNQE